MSTNADQADPGHQAGLDDATPQPGDPKLLVPPKPISAPTVAPARTPGRGRQIGSWALLAAGLLLTIVIAILGTKNDFIPVMTAIALTGSSGLFQVLSVIVGSRARGVDPSLVRALARRLTNVQARMEAAKSTAEAGFESAKHGDDKVTLGMLSVELSHISDHLGESLETWRDLSPDAFKPQEKQK